MTKSTNIRKDFEKCKVVNVVREIKPDNPLYKRWKGYWAIVNNYLTM